MREAFYCSIFGNKRVCLFRAFPFRDEGYYRYTSFIHARPQTNPSSALSLPGILKLLLTVAVLGFLLTMETEVTPLVPSSRLDATYKDDIKEEDDSGALT